MPTSLGPLHLRPLDAGDLDVVAALQEASILRFGGRAYTRPQVEAWARVGVELRHTLLDDGRFFVAEADRGVIGVGGWSPDGRERDLAWVRYLFVHPDVVGRGVGRRLLEEAEATAVVASRRRFSVWSSLIALGFYDRLGFRRRRVGHWPIKGRIELDFVLMEKTLRVGERLVAREAG